MRLSPTVVAERRAAFAALQGKLKEVIDLKR